MKGCVENLFFPVLVNGCFKGFFPSFRCLCQGDPLSPLFFTLFADTLSALLSKVESAWIISGFEVGKNVRLSHLQIADNPFLLLDASDSCVMNMENILKCLKSISGLKFNFSKLSLTRINLESTEVVRLGNIVGCKTDSLPVKYLGFLLGGNPRMISFWDLVLERVNKQ